MVGCPGSCDTRNAVLGYIRNIAGSGGVLGVCGFLGGGGGGES